MKRVYVCSPLRGDVTAHHALAVAVCRAVALAGDAPLAPHLYLPQALDDEDDEERRIGTAAGLSWLEVADEVVVAGPLSAGMRREIEAASALGLPVRFLEGQW